MAHKSIPMFHDYNQLQKYKGPFLNFLFLIQDTKVSINVGKVRRTTLFIILPLKPGRTILHLSLLPREVSYIACYITKLEVMAQAPDSKKKKKKYSGLSLHNKVICYLAFLPHWSHWKVNMIKFSVQQGLLIFFSLTGRVSEDLKTHNHLWKYCSFHTATKMKKKKNNLKLSYIKRT